MVRTPDVQETYEIAGNGSVQFVRKTQGEGNRQFQLITLLVSFFDNYGTHITFRMHLPPLRPGQQSREWAYQATRQHPAAVPYNFAMGIVGLSTGLIIAQFIMDNRNMLFNDNRALAAGKVVPRHNLFIRFLNQLENIKLTARLLPKKGTPQWTPMPASLVLPKSRKRTPV